MKITRVVAIGWITFVISLSIAKSLGYGYWLWGGIQALLGSNRTMHFLMAGIMSSLCLLAARQYSEKDLARPVILFLLAGCIGDELAQYFIPSRHFSPWDALASCAGVLVFALPVLWGSRVFSKSLSD